MRLDAPMRFGEGAPSDSHGNAFWYRSAAVWRFVLTRFVPLLAAGNLVWETLQLPFYTLWREANFNAQMFAVFHCTAGDMMIGTAALLIAVILVGRRGWPHSRHGLVAGFATFIGLTYTVFSEWLNTQVTMGWDYAETMIRVAPLGTGIAPLLQWIIVPPVAYALAHALGRARRLTGTSSV